MVARRTLVDGAVINPQCKKSATFVITVKKSAAIVRTKTFAVGPRRPAKLADMDTGVSMEKTSGSYGPTGMTKKVGNIVTQRRS